MNVTPFTPKAVPAPTDATDDTNLQAIIAEQVKLLAAQAVEVRHLEDQMHVSPPGPASPVPPLPAGTDLQTYMQNQLSAIRSQQGYINNLKTLLVQVPPPMPW